MKGPLREYENFELVFQTLAEDHFPVLVYRSRVTQLTVVVVQVEGPIVDGYITVATEAHDDDGLPHTLEHLVFMGSKGYPSKTILGKLGNRFLSSGTNAWTDTDHTCYTMETAGSEGFCKLLPIFLDHITRPLLKDSAFLTEVHHVNGEGEDSGVVYCEMQARETNGLSMVYRAGLKALYPGHCGYKSDTGGQLKNLRESTTADKVRAYHKAFYRPENVWVCALGQIEPDDILKSVGPVERSLIQDGLNTEPFVRPWMSPVDPLTESVDKLVLFPADVEDNGMVYFFWRGPHASTEQYKIEAVHLLMDYMTASAVSPFRKAFVEIPSPMASGVGCGLTENSVCALTISFHSVPLNVDEEIAPKLRDVIRGLTVDTLDMKRLRTVIHRRKLRSWVAIESNAQSQFGSDLIGAMLYGSKLDDLTKRMNVTQVYDELIKEEAPFWIGLLQEYFGEDKPVVVIRGRPSVSLKVQMETDEKARIEEQKKKLGPEGLAACAEARAKAVAEHEAPFDMEPFRSESTPDASTIGFQSICQYSNFPLPVALNAAVTEPIFEKNAAAPYFNLEALPLRAQVDDVKSRFVRMRVVIDASQIDPELRVYGTLFKEVLTAAPLRLPSDVAWVTEDGEWPAKQLEDGVAPAEAGGVRMLKDGMTFVPFESVTEQLERDTIYYGTSFTPGGYAYSNYFEVSVVVENSKYVRGLQWLRDILYHVFFEPKRVLIMASKLAMGVTQQKKSGSSISAALKAEMNFEKKSYKRLQVFTRQQAFLQRIASDLSKLMDAGESSVECSEANVGSCIGKLDEFRRVLLGNPSGFFLHMSADLAALSKEAGVESLEKPWLDVLLPSILSATGGELRPGSLDLTIPFTPVQDRDAVIPFLGEGTPAAGGDTVVTDVAEYAPDPKKACVVAMGSVDSAYLWQTAGSLMTSYLDPDFLPLLLLNQYLNQESGPFWETLRGKGLTYSFGVSGPGITVGFCSLSLGRSAQIADSYRETLAILREHVEVGFKLDENLLQTARSGLTFDFINSARTVRHLSQLSVVTSFKGMPLSFDRLLLKKIWDVTPEQMLAAGRKHLGPLLEPSKCRCAIVCNPSKIEEIVQEFKEFGWVLTPFNSVDETFLAAQC